MVQAVQRSSLVAQVSDVLREAIAGGKWPEFLPGERALSEDLQVSRPTVRKALALLRVEGLLDTSQGRRTRIVLDSRRPVRHAAHSRVVGFLSPLPLIDLSYHSLFLLGELQRHLAAAEFRLEIYAGRCFDRDRPDSLLKRVVRESAAVCWILHSCPRAVQTWFSAAQIPAISDSYRCEDSALPCIDRDYAAIAQHCGARLKALGHRRLLFLAGHPIAASDMVLERELRQSFCGGSDPGARVLTVRSANGVNDVASILTGWGARTDRPTGLVGRATAETLAAMGCLGAAGLRVPKDVSVVCCMDDPLLAFHVPAVTRYTVNMPSYARRLSRLALRMARGERIGTSAMRLEPLFVAGNTLGPAPGR